MSNARFPSQNSAPQPPSSGRKVARELFGLFLLFWGLLVLLSLVTFHQTDPSLNHVVSNPGPVQNGAGVFGANISGMLVDMFGFAAFVWPAVFLAWGAGCVSTWFTMPWWRWLGFVLLGGCLISLGAAWNMGIGDVRGGGILGMTLFRLSANVLGPTGSILLWFFLFFISLELAFGICWMSLLRRGASYIAAKLAEHDISWQTLPGMLPRVTMPKMPLPQLGRSWRAKNSAADTTVDVIPLLDIHMDDPEDFEPEQPEPEESAADTLKTAQPASADQDASKQDAGSSSTTFIFDDSVFVTPPVATPAASPAPASPPHVDASSAQADPAPATAPAPSASQPGKSPALTAGGTLHLPSLPKFLSRFTVTPPLVPPMPEPVDFARATAQTAPVAPQKTTPVAEPQPVAHVRTERPVQAVSHASGAPHAPHTPDAPGTSGMTFSQRAGTPASTPAATSVAPVASVTPQPESSTVYESGAQPVVASPASTPAPASAPRKKASLPLPPLDLLQVAQQSDTLPSREFMEGKGRRLMACLDDFGIRGELVRVTPGPVVTMFEVRPAPGVKVSRISNLNQDLALSLKAESVRIQAPIPGNDTVGVEIPNENRATVNFRETLESAAFAHSDALLTMALGKDISGTPEVADLAKMPHLLVAGATGAGKSVCLNAILVSILYKATPDQVKILLIDPKRVEFAVYADIPHLVHPIVKETEQAKNALDWAVHEMEERYTAMARLGVRNITEYNDKLKSLGDGISRDLEDLEFLPYLVLIVDELADLMLTGGKDVETAIVRLAQLARACGIHLIIATQRPSVNVVTGLIKANFPCRIAFQVSNKYDSRTILDSVGAELLLGRGDMLFKPSGGKLRRLHGAFVSNEDVVAVVDYWKRQRAPSYLVDFSEWGTQGSEAAQNINIDAGASEEEALYAEVVAFSMEGGQKISISKLQRRFRIGFNKAARFMERMEEDGVMAPAERANRPRQLRD